MIVTVVTLLTILVLVVGQLHVFKDVIKDGRLFDCEIEGEEVIELLFDERGGVGTTVAK